MVRNVLAAMAIIPFAVIAISAQAENTTWGG